VRTRKPSEELGDHRIFLLFSITMIRRIAAVTYIPTDTLLPRYALVDWVAA